MFVLTVGSASKRPWLPFTSGRPTSTTGAPTSVTVYMSVVVKTAAFAALLRVFAFLFPALYRRRIPHRLLCGAGRALTLIIGNFAALLQRSVKRMLAYSAVAHAGYLGLAVLAAWASAAPAAALWYLTGLHPHERRSAFAVLTLIERQKRPRRRLRTLCRSGHANAPWLSRHDDALFA